MRVRPARTPRCSPLSRGRRRAGLRGLVKGHGAAGGDQGAARQDARHGKTRQAAQRATATTAAATSARHSEGDDGGRHGGGRGGRGHARRDAAGQAGRRHAGVGARGDAWAVGVGRRGGHSRPPRRHGTAKPRHGGWRRGRESEGDKGHRRAASWLHAGVPAPAQTGRPGRGGKRRDAPAPAPHNRAMSGVGSPLPSFSPPPPSGRALRAPTPRGPPRWPLGPTVPPLRPSKTGARGTPKRKWPTTGSKQHELDPRQTGLWTPPDGGNGGAQTTPICTAGRQAEARVPRPRVHQHRPREKKLAVSKDHGAGYSYFSPLSCLKPAETLG